MALMTFGLIVLMTACTNKTISMTRVYLIDITGEKSFIPDAEQVKESFNPVGSIGSITVTPSYQIIIRNKSYFGPGLGITLPLNKWVTETMSYQFLANSFRKTHSFSGAIVVSF